MWCWIPVIIFISSAHFEYSTFRDNKDKIGEIFITLDSHHKKHIAHQAFWSNVENDVNSQGSPPGVFQEITEQDLQEGKWFPKDCSLEVTMWPCIHVSLSLYSFLSNIYSCNIRIRDTV